MSEYLLLNIAVIIIPLLLTFEKNLKFYKNLPSVLIAILTVGSIYVVWDIAATDRGDWGFNPEYLTGFYIFNLPIEEVLFFITIPYAIIFLFETANYYLQDREIIYHCRLYTYAAVFFGLSGLAFVGQNYTMTVLFSVSLFFLASRFFNPSLLKSKLYWQFILFSFVPFFVVNYILTSLPIVTYGNNAIWGTRLTTIPVEDFFYSFSLLSFNLLVYKTVKEKWFKRK